jgi:hypothetical protein
LNSRVGIVCCNRFTSFELFSRTFSCKLWLSDRQS